MHGCKGISAGCLIAAVLAVCGCEQPLTPQAKQLLVKASEAIDKKEFPAAVQYSDEFLAKYAKTQATDQAYYTRGLAKYYMNDREGAKADLQQSLARTKLQRLRLLASTALADLAWDQDDMPLAEKYYRQALLYTKAAEEEHARYRLGCVLQRKGAWEEADSNFDRVIHFAADSQTGKLAARRVRSRAWTIQAGAFEQRTRAETELKKLEEGHLSGKVQEVMEDGRLLYLVQIGRYATYEQAVSQLTNVLKVKNDAHVTVTR